jgi:hypothetical protein
VKTTSRNTIRIALGIEFDLMIAQNQIKEGRIGYLKHEILYCFTRIKLDIPLRTNKVR